MNRSVMIVLGWLLATAAAVGVAWAGVQMVSGRVVDPLPPATPLTQTTAGTPQDAATAATAATADATASDTPSATDGPSGTDTATPAQDPVPTHEATTATTEATPTAGSEAAEAQVRSYELVGGSVTLRFEPGAVTVLSAVPRDDDYRLDIEGNGTAEVSVEFESEDHRSRVKGWWESGPRERVEERAEDDESEDGESEPDED